MSAPQVLRALEAQGYRDFRKVEREHGRYEVKARNPEGRVAMTEMTSARSER